MGLIDIYHDPGSRLWPKPEDPEGSYNIDEHHILAFNGAYGKYCNGPADETAVQEDCAGLCATCVKDLNREIAAVHRKKSTRGGRNC